MAAYFRRAGSWSDYLQAQAYVDDITTEISRSAREQVASIEALSRDNIRVNKSVAAAVRQVEVAVWAVDASVQQLDATCRWGFSTLIAVVGRLGESVEELIRIAKIPNRIRAYEYYNDSREAYCRTVFHEAGAAIEKALNGDGPMMTGYRLDWRLFHQKALVNLGGKGELHRFVNLDVATECSATAAGLAVSAGDLPGASVASFTASFADYCRQQYESASEWALKAISFDPKNSAAAFHAAKVLMARGKPQDAVQHLLAAVVLDRRFVLEALDERDGDFAPHRSIITEAFEGLRGRLITELTTDLRILLADPAIWTSLLSTEAESKKWLTIAESLLITEPSAMQLFDVLQLREWRQTRLADVTSVSEGWTINLMSGALQAATGLTAIVRILEQREDFRVRVIAELTTSLKAALTHSAVWETFVTNGEPRESFEAIDALLGMPDKLRMAGVVRLAAWQRSSKFNRVTEVAPTQGSWTVKLLSRAVEATQGLPRLHQVLERVATSCVESEEAAISATWKQAGYGVAAAAGAGIVAALCFSMLDHVNRSTPSLGLIIMGLVGAIGGAVFGLAFLASLVVVPVGVIIAISVTIAKRSAIGQWRSALR